jgi:hypothetical protein
MQMRWLPGLSVVLIASLSGCAGPAGDDTTASGGGKADDPSATCGVVHLDSRGVCRNANGTFAPKACCAASPLERLATALQAGGTLSMPPPGVEFSANEMTAEVSLVAVADPNRVGDTLAPLVTATAAEVDGEATDLLAIIQHPDDHFGLRGGFLDGEVRAALVADVAAGQRDAVGALIDALPGWYGAHLETYDVGSEIVGRDLFFLAPLGDDQALLVVVRYTQS